ncbi:substrate-binding periplasmic protein [Zooshikella ganghwensis]|uniref:substrate-binding periplasmic protein n=1 Tax=Zooshikella ganghwensis TaxID=202772 RepID=UPI0022A82180|nr:transporter substrate-binding domain-containing protein [Zooshikella ganghwensis]
MAANSWAPFVGEELVNKGFSTDLVTNILNKAGYEYEVHIVPWARALNGTYDGDYDALYVAWYSDERAKKLNYAEPYLVNRIKFIKRKGEKVTYKTLEDFKAYKIGIARDYAYQAEFDNATFLKKETARTFVLNLKKLLAKRVDLTLEDEWVAKYEIANKLKEAEGKVEFIDNALSENPLHFVVSRKNPNHETIVKKFNEALAALKKDGTYDEIKALHGF